MRETPHRALRVGRTPGSHHDNVIQSCRHYELVGIISNKLRTRRGPWLRRFTVASRGDPGSRGSWKATLPGAGGTAASGEPTRLRGWASSRAQGDRSEAPSEILGPEGPKPRGLFSPFSKPNPSGVLGSGAKEFLRFFFIVLFHF